MQAEIESPAKLGLLLDAEVPADWPPGEYDRDAQMHFRGLIERADISDRGWYVWYAILPAGGGGHASLVGSGGFMGPPSAAGEVEIGFSVSESHRRRGFAREIVTSLVRFALADSRVRRVMAHTREDNRASRSVLEFAGFRATGPGSEPGTIRYALERAEAQVERPLK